MKYFFPIVIIAAALFLAREFFQAAPVTESSVTGSSPVSRGLVGKWPTGEGKTAAIDDDLAGSYLIVFDASGSMKGRKLEEAKSAVKTLTETVPENDYLGLVVFSNSTVDLLTPLGRGEANRAAFASAVDSVDAGGGTPLGQAVETSVELLAEVARAQGTSGAHYTLLIVTDGEASDGAHLRRVLNTMLPLERPPISPIIFQTIGFGIGERHILNQPGRTLYTSAQDGEALREALKKITVESASFEADTEFQ